jgi:ATP-dependent Clp protease ATP-binding subunit ClpA
MFERFSAGSRRVVVLAQQEAQTLRHPHIGTEHLLLGLIHEESGVAAAILGAAGVTLEAARPLVIEMAGPVPGDLPSSGHMPFTPRAKRILELSLRQALRLKQNYIRTEHLLLGLIDEADGVGAQILVHLAGPLPALREQVLKAAREVRPEPVSEEEAQMWSLQTDRPVPRAVRARPLALGEFGGLLRSIDRRLAAVERHLGLPVEESDPPAAPEDPPAAPE